MARKTQLLDTYELVDIDKIPQVSAPLEATWAKELYEMPPGKAGRLPCADYETALHYKNTILGSVRAARQQKWGMDLQVHTKIAPEGGKYAVYFWKGEAHK